MVEVGERREVEERTEFLYSYCKGVSFLTLEVFQR